MFPRGLSSSLGVIGIDYGSHAVKMLQVRDKGGVLQVVGAARLDIALSPAVAEEPGEGESGDCERSGIGPQLRSAFLAGGFRGSRCVVALAREDICLQSVRLPRMPDAELRQTAVWEASQRFGFERNAMEVDFIRTGATLQSGENREEVILIAASHAAIAARVEPVLAAGLRPIAVDTGFSALGRAFSRMARRETDRANVRAVVEVGYAGTTVLILRGDQIAFCKPIAIGGQHFNRAVADHLQMDVRHAAELRSARIAVTSRASEDQAHSSNQQECSPCTDPSTDRAVYEAVRPLMGDLVKEVSLCLRYYGVTFRGHPPDHIILTGGEGWEPRLGEVLANTCKTPVVYDDSCSTLRDLSPMIRISLHRTPGPAATWAVALGVSLRGTGRHAHRADAARVAA